MAGGYNPNRAKIHRSYTVEEVAELFGVHKNTVHAWIKKGLPVCDDQRPTLILGGHLREFLRALRHNRKRKCGPGELYCLGCKAPRKPAESMVDYEPVTETTGRLIGICPVCDNIINQYASLARLAGNPVQFDIRFPSDQEHIGDRDISLLNSDLNR